MNRRQSHHPQNATIIRMDNDALIPTQLKN
jgi:hypothetical protein